MPPKARLLGLDKLLRAIDILFADFNVALDLAQEQLRFPQDLNLSQSMPQCTALVHANLQ